MTNKALAVAFVLLAPLQAAAQGPMIVERVQSGFVATPEVKETEVDHRASTLVGGSAGWIADETIFFGGGGYWLANNSRDREMAYGGFVVQWLARANERVGFAAKGLVGGGRATLSDSFTQIVRVPRTDVMRTVTTQIRVRDDFFVAEPGADLRLRLTEHARLTAGAAYRFVAGERHDDSRLRGAVVSVGLELGTGF